MNLYYARTIVGLENFCAEEIRHKLNATILEIGHREILFQANENIDLSKLCSIDDIFYFCGVVYGIDRTRYSLTRIAKQTKKHLNCILKYCKSKHSEVKLKVVVSFLGKKNYSRYEVEDIVGFSIAETLNIDYVSSKELYYTDLLRIHIRDNTAIFAMQVFDQPLYKRHYKKYHIPGATHGQVGYVMSMLSQIDNGYKILDPYCGTATILIETALSNQDKKLTLVGIDISEKAINFARENIKHSNINNNVLLINDDSSIAFIKDNYFDRIISNVPWGEQVALAGSVENINKSFERLGRLLKPSGCMVLLTYGENLRFNGFDIEQNYPLRLSGKYANILVMRKNKK